MTRDDQVLQLLAEANPVADPSQFAIDAATSARLEAVAQWSEIMDTELRTIEPPTTTATTAPPRRGWLAVAVTAVLVLFVGIGGWMMFGPNTDETTIPLYGAEGNVDAEEAFTTVSSAFAAYNAGDMDTWALWREGGAATAADYAYELAAGSRIDVEQCTYRGFQEWPMDDLLMIGHGFDCVGTQTDKLLSAAGVELETTHNWVIGADPASSLGASNEDPYFYLGFIGEFRDWLATSYPDVELSFDYAIPNPSLAYLTPESVPTALEYIDEFVDQSDEYPLTEPVPAPHYGPPVDEHPTTD